MEREQKNREILKAIILDLSSSQELFSNSEKLQEIGGKLEDIYALQTPSPGHPLEVCTKFRHYYSDIFATIRYIQQDESGKNINNLEQNILYLWTEYGFKHKDLEIKKSIQKLYDHVSLDIARINYTDKGDNALRQREEIKKISAQNEANATTTGQVKEELKTLAKNLSSAQREYIAILGVFAAIVLAFTAGIAFSNSLLENFHKASIYRIITTILLLGFVLINTIHMLCYSLDRLVRHTSEPKLKYFWFTNMIIGILLALTVVAWYYGIVETRNNSMVVEQVVDENKLPYIPECLLH